jgi:glycosyltransferase involved in cell wall biosynthesis
LDILIKAFGMLTKDHPDAMLVITGPDNENFGSKVREWINQEGIHDKVIFTGMLTGQAKLAVLRDADLFVLPSYSENFGISVVEAMACGTPVVISDKVNIWREVVEHQAGKVAPCDPRAFYERIDELLTNLPLAKILGENGRELVQEYYQWSHVGEKLEYEYNKIIGRNQRTYDSKVASVY